MNFCVGQVGILVRDVVILEWLRLHWLVGWGGCFTVAIGNCNSLPVFVEAEM